MNRRLILIRRILLGIALFLALVLLGLDRYAAMVHRPSPTSTRVAIYTTARCPYCERLRRDLKASGVPYQEYDVEKSFQGQMGFWTLHARGVPVSVIGPAIIYGYRVEEIQEALRKLGYAYRSTSPERTLFIEPSPGEGPFRERRAGARVKAPSKKYRSARWIGTMEIA